MSYDSEVLADSPWCYGKTDDASGDLADSSGNSRTIVLGGGSPTYQQTGPSGAADAITWPDSSGATEYYATTATSVPSGMPYTLEVWVDYSGTPPTNPTPLVGLAYGYGNNSRRPVEMYLDTDGKIKLLSSSSNTSAPTRLAASSALTAGYHHVVGVFDSASRHLRIDKSTVASDTLASSLTTTATFFVHGGGADASLVVDLTNGSAVKMSKPAVYRAALTDTRIDAHYNAMLPSGDATVSAVAATATASATAPAVTADATVTAPTATATAAATEPTISGAGDATVNPPAATVTAEALPPTLAWDANLAAATATATADALAPTVTAHAAIAAPAATATATAEPPDIDNGSGNRTVAAPVATATATAHAPVFTANYEVGTDTTNTFTGLDLTARGTVTIAYPTATPTVDLGTRVDAALPYPQPVMDNGRPT